MRNRFLILLLVAALVSGTLLVFLSTSSQAATTSEASVVTASEFMPWLAAERQLPSHLEEVPADVQELFAEGMTVNEFVQMAGYVPRALEGLVDGEALMIIEFAEAPMAVRYAEQKAAGVEMTTEALEDYQKTLLDAQTAITPQIESLGATIISNYTAAYNGMQVYTPLSALNDLRTLPGVKAIHRAPLHDITLGGSVDLIGASDVWADFGYDGDGMVIAIIDTGIDYTHAAFGGSGDPNDYANNDPDIIEPGTFPTAKVIGGYDFAGTTYNADPSSPAYQPIPNPDRDPLDENRHGTHVASIAAGEAAGDVDNGVAPGAKLMAMKVFGTSGSTALVIDALDFSTYSYLMFGYPQIINMSLGSNFGTDDSAANPSVAGSNNAAAAGIVVVASAGNAGNFHYITGAPGSASKAISVASSTTGFSTGPTVNISGTAFVTQTNIIYSVASFANNTGHYVTEVAAPLGYAGALSGATDNQLCTTAGIPANALLGQVALIQRGTCAFTIKVNNAAALGAVGAIIYNNAAGAFGMTGDPVTIPAGSIQMQDGMNLISANGQIVVVSAEDDVSTVPDPYTPADFISGFSSRGPRGYDSAMKPEITAPGSGIFAANMASGSGGVSLSGTSMAAPHVAGVAALMLEGNPTMTPEQVKAAMMNTTVPLADGTVIPRSGSGRVNAYRAVDTEAIAVGDDDLVSLSFGVIMSRNNNVSRVKEVTVYNWSASPVTYNVTAAFQTGSNTVGATIGASAPQVTVPAGGSATVDVTLTLDMTQIPANFSATAVEEYYGFVTFTPVGGDPTDALVVPFYAQARPYSQLEEIVATGSIGDPDTDYITYEITHLGPISSSLWVYPALVWNEEPDPMMYGPGDVRLFGMDYAGFNATYGDIMAVGIDAWSYWHTPQPQFAEFDLYIDADQDGVWDYVNFNWNNGARTGAANNNTWVVTQVDLATNMVFLGSPFTIYTDFNSSYMEWYLPAAWQDLGPTASTFDYQLLGFDPGGVSTTPAGSFDYVNYPFEWLVSNNPGPANRDAEVWVAINDLEGYFYSEPAGVMIVDYRGDPRNVNGGQAYFQPLGLDIAWLQVAHLAPFAMDPGTAVTITLNGAPALTDFAYGDSTGYIQVPADTYLVEIFPGSSATPAITGSVTLDPLTYYTAIAYGDGANQDLGLMLLEDDPTPPAPGMFHLRLGHLAPFASGPATADIRLEDGTLVLGNVDFGDVTGFLPLPAGEYDLKITTPGGAVTLIDPLPVTFTEGQILSAFATGDGNNQKVGAFALPAGDPGFFLPLRVYELLMPVIVKNFNPADWLNLTLLHTNDFHARVDEYNRDGSFCTPAAMASGLCIGGAPRMATVVDALRNSYPNLLLLDAGDQFQGTLFYNVFRGDVLTLTMNYLGYDAMALGNHEFDNGPETLASFISGADFPVVSANTDASADPFLQGMIPPYTILEQGGQQIGVIGLITPDTSNISSPGNNVTFTDPVASLQAAADALEAMGVDKIIALTHMGYDVDLDLAAQVSGVDIIIGGHSHSFLYYPAAPISFAPPVFPQFGPLVPVGEYPTVVESLTGDPVLVVTAYQWGSFLGHLDVVFNNTTGLVHGYNGNPIFLGSNIAKDPVLDEMLEPYREAVADLRATQVGTTTVDLLIVSGGQQICRLGECLMGNLVADAMLWKVNEIDPVGDYQIAFQNGGGLRAPIPAGPVTMGQVLETLPFGNAIATFELQGQYVKAALENGARLYPSANGGFAQVSGLRYQINPTQPVGSRIVNVEVRNGTGWDPLDMNAMYKVVTNDFMRRGGDNYLVFRDHAVNPYDFGPLLDEALAEYFQTFSPVTPTIEGRITFTP